MTPRVALRGSPVAGVRGKEASAGQPHGLDYGGSLYEAPGDVTAAIPSAGVKYGRVLLVCTGNVCRSPYMERRLRQALEGTGVEVVSAGTRALVGADIEPGSAALLTKAGASVDGYAARQLTREIVAGADLVLTAARKHRGPVAQLYPKALRYTFTWGDFVDLVAGLGRQEIGEPEPGANWVRHVAGVAAARRGVVLPRPVHETDIPDPYRQDRRAFARMADSVEAGLPSIVAALTPWRRG